MKKPLLAAAVALSLTIPAAQAALYDFSYTSSSGILAGTVDGVLQADNNTLVVSSVLDFATFAGVPGPSLPFLYSLDLYAGLSGTGSPTLTLDGSFADFLACNTASPNCFYGEGFLISVGNLWAAQVGQPIFNGSVSFGYVSEPYVQTNWSLAAVPAPATLPLLALGAAALGWGRGRRPV